MSGYDDIKRAREIAQADQLEYEKKCVRFISEFCEGFSKQVGVECGRDTRRGAPWEAIHKIESADKPVSFVDPPMFRDKDSSVWTEMTVDSRKFDVVVWNMGDSFKVRILGREFTGSERIEAFTHIKDRLIEGDENGLNVKRDWLK